MKLPCTMGCGRSKSHTIGLDDNSDQESTSTSQKSNKKQTKSANKSRDKENRDQGSRTSTENPKQNGLKVSETKSTRQEINTNSSSNGSIIKETCSGTDIPESKEQTNELPQVKTAFKDRQQLSTGALQSSNTKITGSQIEFFKMLDEKIEKGTEYEECS